MIHECKSIDGWIHGLGVPPNDESWSVMPMLTTDEWIAFVGILFLNHGHITPITTDFSNSRRAPWPNWAWQMRTQVNNYFKTGLT